MVQMPVKPATEKKPVATKSTARLVFGAKSLIASRQSRFTTSKLIQNLGSGNDGVQFDFLGDLRSIHGRD